ncbi:nesprin-2 [Pleuronectes platessa]|uniref:nesprin-2 n=1 Tax=Pleuronectes platessa TaxID=8262 RepID=UPI00232A42FC|nr:nesprin-2 [Pleuronectes platessa]
MMSRWSQSGVAASEEMDVDQRHEHFLQCVALRKQLESRWDLKVSMIGAGSQLVELREAVGHSDSNVDDSETSDPRLCSIVSQLRQTEADWSSLVAEVPVVQRALHQRWLEMLTQQGALQELQVWLGAAESRLQENHRTWSTLTGLQQNLRSFQECRVELSAHQATLDLVNQPSQTYSTESGQMGRYDHNQFAEDQGRLNHQWLVFQETLNAQIQELEQTLRSRAEREARLQQINIWITEQNLWMDSAQTPSSQTDLQRSLHRCQDLEEKIRQKAAALQELREKLCDGRGDDSFISQIEKSILTCADLTQQRDSVKLRLVRAQQLWDRVETSLNQMKLKTLSVSQTLVYHSDPQLCLQAHKHLHERLQLLHEETQAAESLRDELSQTVSSLRDIISPEAAGLLTEQLDRHTHSWTVACGSVHQQLQRSQSVLQLWELYGRLEASFSRQLQRLQSDVTSALSATPAEDNSPEQVAVKMDELQSLLQRADTSQSDLQGVLEASKHLTSHLEPSAAALVQSQSRLLTRDVLQLVQKLTGELGQLQEELRRLQEFGGVLESVERNLEVWTQRLENVAQAGDQSGLLELSGRSADLDVLNELSCSRTPGDAAARHLLHLNRRWAATAARAEEACRSVGGQI